ncbi:RING [Seminavis robusta]|uniref:RING n=1 Tax=Seminavis robusta TaxID=568900 RepID=A0A9N8HQL7_9STRA|nr:RING [Seminavis robusta]|eukprot:Sro1302_g260890.1 RING (470) ;mRNA; r:11541-13108
MEAGRREEDDDDERKLPPGRKDAQGASPSLQPSEGQYVGTWTMEEKKYVEALIAEFRAGNILNLPEKSTLRAFIANKLGCSEKRITKKYERTGYNGRLLYTHRPDDFTPEESQRRLERLEELEVEFQQSRARLLAMNPPNYHRAKRKSQDRAVSPLRQSPAPQQSYATGTTAQTHQGVVSSSSVANIQQRIAASLIGGGDSAQQVAMGSSYAAARAPQGLDDTFSPALAVAGTNPSRVTHPNFAQGQHQNLASSVYGNALLHSLLTQPGSSTAQAPHLQPQGPLPVHQPLNRAGRFGNPTLELFARGILPPDNPLQLAMNNPNAGGYTARRSQALQQAQGGMVRYNHENSATATNNILRAAQLNALLRTNGPPPVGSAAVDAPIGFARALASLSDATLTQELDNRARIARATGQHPSLSVASISSSYAQPPARREPERQSNLNRQHDDAEEGKHDSSFERPTKRSRGPP